jgi:hypothetical protein
MSHKYCKGLFFSVVLVLLSGCFKEDHLSFKIADAENQFFTKTGRLFVTGGENIYEVKRDSSNKLVRSRPLFEENCYATGLVERKGYLYATCTSLEKLHLKNIFKIKNCKFKDQTFIHCIKSFFSKSYLLAAKLTESPRFQIISSLESILFPNGLSVDDLGRLYSADSASRKIFRINISHDDPFYVEEIRPWFRKGLIFPNGLKIKRNKIYFTDLNTLKSLKIKRNGSPGIVKIIYKSPHMLDELSFFKNKILLTKISKGVITLVKKDGTSFDSPRFSMNPSSILQGRLPLFKENQFVITDKGFMYEFNSKRGNRLKIVTVNKLFMKEI